MISVDLLARKLLIDFWLYQPPKSVVLKLVVATLLRVAKCPKRVTKFEKKKNLV